MRGVGIVVGVCGGSEGCRGCDGLGKHVVGLLWVGLVLGGVCAVITGVGGS
jgi:hypothetical protein